LLKNALDNHGSIDKSDVPGLFQQVNNHMLEQGGLEGWDMRSTLDVLLVSQHEFSCWHVGDSRIYGVKQDGQVKKFTIDHNMTQEGIDKFGEDPITYKFAIDPFIPKGPTRYLGIEEDIVPQEIGSKQQEDYSRIFMTTDGLPDMLLDNDLEHLFRMRKVKDSIASMIHAYDSGGSVEAFIRHSPLILEWTDSGKIIHYAKNENEESVILGLMKEVDKERITHIKMQTIQERISDGTILQPYIRAGRDYLSRRDNWSFIMLEMKK